MPYKDPGKKREYARNWQREYSRRPENLEKGRERSKTRRKEWNDYLSEIKNSPCFDCGDVHPPEIMDFDHVPERGVKIKELSKFPSKSARALQELEKCDIVCPTCHRYRTVNRLNVQSFQFGLIERINGII